MVECKKKQQLKILDILVARGKRGDALKLPLVQQVEKWQERKTRVRVLFLFLFFIVRMESALARFRRA